uniref:Uncharacterized protein n=1 Tax=Pyramimonas obovata TaxID=1411642 RepID=A0A7S0QMJ0_9CHLO|mmetsp:Transcript_11102/g.23155  ORF Transcript_11102/g.23155 Transcript_11102/m.23155 type:complete len:110 (+) Transcript_11102:2-331(+)
MKRVRKRAKALIEQFAVLSAKMDERNAQLAVTADSIVKMMGLSGGKEPPSAGDCSSVAAGPLARTGSARGPAELGTPPCLRAMLVEGITQPEIVINQPTTRPGSTIVIS